MEKAGKMVPRQPRLTITFERMGIDGRNGLFLCLFPLQLWVFLCVCCSVTVFVYLFLVGDLSIYVPFYLRLGVDAFIHVG